MYKRKYSGPVGPMLKKYRAGKPARQAARRRANPRSGGFLGIESKFVDYEYDAAVNKAVVGGEADPATALSLSVMAQGDGESQRDGRKCIVTSVQVTGVVELDFLNDGNSTALGKAATVRVVLVQDTQTNGAQLNAEDVIKDSSDTDLDPLGFRNLQYTKRFRVLADKLVTLERQATFLEAAGAYDSPPVRKSFKMYKKLRMPVEHTGTTAAVSTVNDNSIHVLCFSGANDADATLRYQSRVRFQG